MVWPNDNLPTFVMDKDAYALNNAFMEECAQAISMYSGEAKKRSYGVRDEYRVGGMAMDHVMDDLCKRVRHLFDLWYGLLLTFCSLNSFLIPTPFYGCLQRFGLHSWPDESGHFSWLK